jgi:hypothetical protein
MRIRASLRRVALAAVGAGLTIAVMQAGGVSANASMRVTDVPYAFSAPSTVTIEYGQFWEFYAQSDQMIGNMHKTSVVVAGAPDYHPDADYPSDYQPQNFAYISIWPSSSQPPLEPATYKITTSTWCGWPDMHTGELEDEQLATTDVPATLVVTPAKLGSEVKVVGDPNNREAAVITAKFTGQFVDEYRPRTGRVEAPITPGGTWSIRITDPTGDVVLEQTIERAAGETPLANTVYWTEGEPGTDYDVEATFTLDGESANRYELTQPTASNYTASEDVREAPTSTAKPVARDLQEAGFTLPLWAVVLLGLVLAGLAGAVALFTIRFVASRPTVVSTGGVDVVES